MRNKLIKITVFLAAFMLVAGLATSLGYEFPRHENPEEVEVENPDPQGLFSIYSKSLSHLSEFQWKLAYETLDFSEGVYVPEDIRSVNESLGLSIRKLSLNLENAAADVENAISLAIDENFGGAIDELNSAKFYLTRGRREVRTVRSRADDLGEGLNVEVPQDFVENLSRVENLIDRYYSRIDELREENVLENLGGLENVLENLGGLENVLENLGGLENVIRFQKPDLTVSAPENVYPGENFKIDGLLELEGKPLSGFTVKAYWLSQSRTVDTDGQGEFSIGFEVPPNVSSGAQELRVLSMPKGFVGSARFSDDVIVTRVPSRLVLDDTGISFSGFHLTVKGRVEAEGKPLENCDVSLIFSGEKSAVVTSEDGRFEISSGVPLLNFSGSQEYKIVAKPNVPWIATSRESGEIFVLNLFTVVLAPLLILGVMAHLLRGRIGGEEELRPEKREERKASEVSYEEVEGKGGFRDMFLRSVRAVVDLTGLSIRPNQTIREYLSTVRKKLGRAFGPFKQISLKFEEYLYSDHEVGEDRSLLDKLLKFLKGDES